MDHGVVSNEICSNINNTFYSTWRQATAVVIVNIARPLSHRMCCQLL